MKNIYLLKIALLCLMISPLYAMRGARAALMRQPKFAKSFQHNNSIQKNAHALNPKRINQRTLKHSQHRLIASSSAFASKNASPTNQQANVQQVKNEQQAPLSHFIKEEVAENKETQQAPKASETTVKPIRGDSDDVASDKSSPTIEQNKINQNINSITKPTESFKSFIAKNKIKTQDPYASLHLVDQYDEEIINNDDSENYIPTKQKTTIKEPTDLFNKRWNEFNASQKKYEDHDRQDQVSAREPVTKHMTHIHADNNNTYEPLKNQAAKAEVSENKANEFQFGQMITADTNMPKSDNKNETQHQNTPNPVKDKSTSSSQIGQIFVNGTNAITNGFNAAWKYGKDGLWYLWNNGLWKPMESFSTEKYEKDPNTKKNVKVIKSKLRIYFEKYICKENMNLIAPLMRIGTGLLVCMLWYNPALFGSTMTENTLMLWVARLGLSTVQLISGEAPVTALANIGLSKFASVLMPYISSWFGTSGAAVAAANNVPNMPPAIKDTVNLSGQSTNNAKKMGWGSWAFSWMKSITTWTSWYKMFSSLKFQNPDKGEAVKVEASQLPTVIPEDVKTKIDSQLSDDGKTKFLEMTLKFKDNAPDPDHLQEFFETASKEDQEKLLQLMSD
ncbi:MAG TPA: hypothetical protein VL201_03965 [Patescibacteria group bacterium]|nr:hypothetical protein [Patescibacteria group bacterium]